MYDVLLERWKAILSVLPFGCPVAAMLDFRYEGLEKDLNTPTYWKSHWQWKIRHEHCCGSLTVYLVAMLLLACNDIEPHPCPTA